MVWARTRRSLYTLVFTAGFASTSLVATAASAQTDVEVREAKKTAGEGLEAYKSGKFEAAVGLFLKAKQDYPSAQVLRMLGYSQLALQHWKEAAEALDASLASTLGPLGEDDRADVEQNRSKALTHLALLSVSTDAPDAALTVDEEPPLKLPLARPLYLKPGAHSLAVAADGYEVMTRSVTVEAGRTLSLVLALKPIAEQLPAEPEPEPEPPAPVETSHKRDIYRGVGVGLAGVGVLAAAGAITTAVLGAQLRSRVASDAQIHNDFYPSGCVGPNARLCQYDVAVVNQDADRADTLRDVSIGLGIGAGVFVAGGAALFLFAPRDEARPTTACAPSLGGLMCAGTF